MSTAHYQVKDNLSWHRNEESAKSFTRKEVDGEKILFENIRCSIGLCRTRWLCLRTVGHAASGARAVPNAAPGHGECVPGGSLEGL